MLLLDLEHTKVRDERHLRALTGLDSRQIHLLLPQFTQAREQLEEEAYQERKKLDPYARKPGGGRKGKLPTDEEKLIFILYYMKAYPTFDMLGDKYDMSRSSANENVYKMFPILTLALSELGAIPHRHFETVEAFQEALGDTERIIIDATERAYRRSIDSETQRKYYSGKKKQHTVKNTVITRDDKSIFFLGDTFEGHTHDYTMLKTEFPPELDWFLDLDVLADLGYLGITSHYQGHRIQIPHKTPPKTAHNPDPKLTDQQKSDNSAMSKIRILVENAIGGIKRFNILVHQFRNRGSKYFSDKLEDTVISLAAGLWNLSLA